MVHSEFVLDISALKAIGLQSFIVCWSLSMTLLSNNESHRQTFVKHQWVKRPFLR